MVCTFYHLFLCRPRSRVSKLPSHVMRLSSNALGSRIRGCYIITDLMVNVKTLRLTQEEKNTEVYTYG